MTNLEEADPPLNLGALLTELNSLYAQIRGKNEQQYLSSKVFKPEMTRSELIESEFFTHRSKMQGAEIYLKSTKKLIATLLQKQEESLFDLQVTKTELIEFFRDIILKKFARTILLTPNGHSDLRCEQYVQIFQLSVNSIVYDCITRPHQNHLEQVVCSEWILHIHDLLLADPSDKLQSPRGTDHEALVDTFMT